MTRLAHLIVRRRYLVIAAWLVLTVVGGISATRLADRWFQEFSIPNQPAYEANQRAVAALGNGRVGPMVAVLKADGDITKVKGVERAFERAAAVTPQTRISSYFTTGDPVYLSKDRRGALPGSFPAGGVGLVGGGGWAGPGGG